MTPPLVDRAALDATLDQFHDQLEHAGDRSRTLGDRCAALRSAAASLVGAMRWRGAMDVVDLLELYELTTAVRAVAEQLELEQLGAPWLGLPVRGLA